MHLLVSVRLCSQQTGACLQADDTEGAPLLADAAAVVLSSPPSQVIIKDEVHTSKPPDCFCIVQYHLKLYVVTLDATCCPVPARVKFSLDCFVDVFVLLVATLLQQRMDMVGTVWLSHSIATIKTQCCCMLKYRRKGIMHEDYHTTGSPT